jgi:hypothetical protein
MPLRVVEGREGQVRIEWEQETEFSESECRIDVRDSSNTVLGRIGAFFSGK